MSASKRLREAVEEYAPKGPFGRVRSFHRAVRQHTTTSFRRLNRYLDGQEPIPDSFLDAAATVLPVSAEWLRDGDPVESSDDGSD